MPVIRLLLVVLVVLLLFGWASPPLTATGRRQLKRLALGALLAAAVLMLLRAGLMTLAALGIGSVIGLRLVLPALVRLIPAARSSRSFSASVRTPGGMTREHALEVLNLKEGASREEILSSYRELIRKVHPDRGGSSYLAAEVNRARDVLLG